MASKAKPTDTTGRIREEAQKQQIEQQQEAANRMSMATAQAQVDLETNIIDATVPGRATVIIDEPTLIGEKNEANVVIRVVEDVENMTFGVNNFYSFKAGQKYEVTRDVAEHLRVKGYLAASF